jgi:glycosyltransferase involved in cell wall biosynthesis
VTKILAMLPHALRPDSSAGDLRFAALLGFLERRGTVDLVESADPRHPGEAGRLAALRKYFGGRIFRSDRQTLRLALHLRLYSLSVIEFWHTAETLIPLIRRYQPWVNIVVDSVDVHFVREAAASDLGLMDAELVAANKRRELAVYRQADAVIVVSEDDRARLVAEGISTPIFVIPIIVGLVTRREEPRAREVLFVGGFRHRPNTDGVGWFVKECWNRVRAEVADATLTIVGSNPTEEVRALGAQPGVRVEGYVPDTAPYLQRAAVSIAPLRYGGGMKGKVCEALAASVPLVTTSEGASGISLEHRVHAWIADRPDDFAAGVVECLRYPAAAEAMGNRGQAVINALCGEEAVDTRVAEFLGATRNVPPAWSKVARWAARGSVVIATSAARRAAPNCGARQLRNSIRRLWRSVSGERPKSAER